MTARMFRANEVDGGKVRVFDKHKGTWVSVPAIDARDYINTGVGCMEGPDYEIKGPAGLRRCTEDMLEGFKKEGYEVVRKIGDDAEKGVAPPPKDPPKEPEPYDFSAANKATLVDFASQAKIEGADKMNKDELVAALTEKKFRPIGA